MVTFHVQQEGPVNALALNKDNTQVAIGGRNVFKVYTIEENKFKEVCNLRASKHLNLSFSCNDVSWSSTDDHYLATAATNGHVCVWNLTKTGKAMQEQDYQDHKRTVNKVNFHASESYKLISGSQDGTMRYFDIRVKNAVAVFHSNTESVRDVQFSPHNPYAFAAVSDNGSVQLWDVRKPDKCQQQFTAHSGPVFACDWHPETTWLATASRDKTVKVWDLVSKPTLEFTIHTIASIGHVKWRPQRKYHIASCALVIDSSINIWDVRRPYIPFASFNEHRDIASGVAWRSDPHIFLSSGRDCTLYQHDFGNASRPASKANPQSVSLNNRGEVLYAHKINMLTSNLTNHNAFTKATAGLMRKISNTQSTDHFHQAASLLHHYHTNVQSQEANVFLNLAKHYQLHGRSVSELCDHNAAVAREFGKTYIATVWQVVKTVYGEEFIQNSNTSENTSCDDLPCPTLPLVQPPLPLESNVDSDQQSKTGGGTDTPAAQFSGGDEETENEDQVDNITIPHNGFPNYLNVSHGLPKGDFSFGENELDMELEGITSAFQNGFINNIEESSEGEEDSDEYDLPNEAFSVRQEILDRSRPPEQLPNNPSPEFTEEHSQDQAEDASTPILIITKILNKTSWDPANIVVEALKHHAILGDIQTATSILIVLGGNRKYLTAIDESMQEHWLLGYIELLSRYKLWNIANQIVKLAWLPSVNQLNHQSTRINTNCSQCTKPLQRTGWLCDRCHSAEYALCSVCHQVVKGLYVWCQGCSHGGHISHMKIWIEKKKLCPSGCGHACKYL